MKVKFEQAKNDEIISISDNLTIVKREIKEFIPSLDGPFINIRAIALMAHEYLALLIGEFIYDKKFDDIREYIINNIESKKIIINRFIQKDRKCAPYFKIFSKFFKEKISITLSFFGFIIFIVDFYFQITRVKDYVIVQDLEYRRIFLADSLKDAKQNKFLLLK